MPRLLVSLVEELTEERRGPPDIGQEGAKRNFSAGAPAARRQAGDRPRRVGPMQTRARKPEEFYCFFRPSEELGPDKRLWTRVRHESTPGPSAEADVVAAATGAAGAGCAAAGFALSRLCRRSSETNEVTDLGLVESSEDVSNGIASIFELLACLWMYGIASARP